MCVHVIHNVRIITRRRRRCRWRHRWRALRIRARAANGKVYAWGSQKAAPPSRWWWWRRIFKETIITCVRVYTLILRGHMSTCVQARQLL